MGEAIIIGIIIIGIIISSAFSDSNSSGSTYRRTSLSKTSSACGKNVSVSSTAFPTASLKPSFSYLAY